MKTSKQILREKGILPKLRLAQKVGKGAQSTGAQKVKMISDSIIEKVNPETGEMIKWMRYVVEHNGEKKVYDTKLYNDAGEPSYLVQHLSEIDEGEEIILEMKRQGVKMFVSVTRLGETKVFEESHESAPVNKGQKAHLEYLSKLKKDGKSLTIGQLKSIKEEIKALGLDFLDVFREAENSKIYDYDVFFDWLRNNYAEETE